MAGIVLSMLVFAGSLACAANGSRRRAPLEFLAGLLLIGALVVLGASLRLPL